MSDITHFLDEPRRGKRQTIKDTIEEIVDLADIDIEADTYKKQNDMLTAAKVYEGMKHDEMIRILMNILATLNDMQKSHYAEALSIMQQLLIAMNKWVPEDGREEFAEFATKMAAASGGKVEVHSGDKHSTKVESGASANVAQGKQVEQDND